MDVWMEFGKTSPWAEGTVTVSYRGFGALQLWCISLVARNVKWHQMPEHTQK